MPLQCRKLPKHRVCVQHVQRDLRWAPSLDGHCENAASDVQVSSHPGCCSCLHCSSLPQCQQLSFNWRSGQGWAVQPPCSTRGMLPFSELMAERQTAQRGLWASSDTQELSFSSKYDNSAVMSKTLCCLWKYNIQFIDLLLLLFIAKICLFFFPQKSISHTMYRAEKRWYLSIWQNKGGCLKKEENEGQARFWLILTVQQKHATTCNRAVSTLQKKWW